MRNLILTIILMVLGCMPMFGQQQAKSTNPKTFVVKTTKSAVPQDSVTGVTIQLKDGKTYPVFRGSRGGLYVYRVAKKGANAGQKIRVALSSCMSKEEYASLKKMCGVK